MYSIQTACTLFKIFVLKQVLDEGMLKPKDYNYFQTKKNEIVKKTLYIILLSSAVVT